MKQIIIGRLGNQPFPLNDSYVSSQHAVVTIKDNGQITIKDSKSVNGTFLHNGTTFVRLSPNKEYPVTADSFVRLGPYTQFHVGKVIPPEEKVDISHLKHVYNRYNHTKMELQAKSQTINGARSFSLLASVVVLPGVSMALNAILGEGYQALSWSVGAICAALTAVILWVVISNMLKKNILEQNNNETNFRRMYVCPKCHTPHGTQLYDNILATGQCPKCKAKYYDSELGY